MWSRLPSWLRQTPICGDGAPERLAGKNDSMREGPEPAADTLLAPASAHTRKRLRKRLRTAALLL